MPGKRRLLNGIGSGLLMALISLFLPPQGLAGPDGDPAGLRCETLSGDSFSPLLRWSTGRVYIQPPTYQYQLQVIPYANDGPGLDLIRTKTTNDPEAFQVPPPPRWYGLLPGMSYTWRVRLSDKTAFAPPDDPAWSGWSPPCTFTTPAARLDTIRPAQPAPGAAGQSRTPGLQWTNSQQEIFYYEVQLSADPRFETVPTLATASLYWNLIHGGASTPQNSWTVPTASALQPDTTYHWRVRPRIQGDGRPLDWPPAWSFTTAPASSGPSPVPSPSPAPSPSPSPSPAPSPSPSPSPPYGDSGGDGGGDGGGGY